MKVLITGAAGFVGSHLAEHLVDLGHDVVGLDCFTDYYSRELKDINANDLRAKGIDIQELDLSRDDLTPAMDGIEAIFHLAAQPGISAKTPFPDYLRNNIEATHNLANAALNCPTLKCLMNISTSSVYGANATDDEETAPKPTSWYGVTKLTAEQLLLALHREKNLPVCSLRLFSVYGERERPEKLYPRLIKSILEGTEFPLYEGSREHSRSFTYVGDIIEGFVAALDNMDRAIGQIFNIGSDIEITTGAGIEIVEKIMGQKALFAMKPKRPGDQLRTHANIDKARNILGYSPKTTPREGLEKEVVWYRERIHGKVS